MFYADHSVKLNDLDLNKVHVFFAVVADGGVGKAAQRLGRTSSAVSQSIAALESALGCKLFDRVGKALVLTRSGQHLHENLREFQSTLARTIAEVARQDDEVQGAVRIGCFLGFPRIRLAELAARFVEEFPKASLRVVYASQDELVERLRRNRLDFVFSFRPRTEENPGVTSTELFAQELVLISSPKFFPRGFAPEELSRVPVVDYYQTDPLILRWLAHHYGERAIRPDVRFWAATTDLVLDLVDRGAGVGVLPRDVAAPPLRDRRVKVLGPRREPLIDHIWLIEPRGSYRDATQEAFRRLVLAELT
jgi:DNA-binding transcriptional LysR family regulator